MRKASKFQSISDSKVEKLTKVNQAKVKGGFFLDFGCPPPIGK